MVNQKVCQMILVAIASIFLLVACTPTEPDITKTASTSSTGVSNGPTTMVTSTETTSATIMTTTTTTTLPSTGNIVVTTTTVPTTHKTVPSAIVEGAREEFVFAYESEDYSSFYRYIAAYFPEEKHIDSFRVKKIDTTNKKYDGYRIVFNRWINGCETASFYVFYFDTEGNLVEVSHRSFEYTPSKVKPPRAATEAEIEAAKQEEAKKIPDGMVVWEQSVSNSSYSIYADENDFTITTVYTSQKWYDLCTDPDSEYYGTNPPHGTLIETYTIKR